MPPLRRGGTARIRGGQGYLCLASASLTGVSVSFGRITQNWFPSGLPGRPRTLRAAGQVEAQAVLDRLRIRDRHKAQAGGRVLAGPGDDLAVTRAEDLPAGCLRPEPGQPGQVVSVSDDVMEPDRHAVRMRTPDGSSDGPDPCSSVSYHDAANAQFAHQPLHL